MNYDGGRYEFEPSVSLNQEECEKQVYLDLVPGKNMDTMLLLKFPIGN